MRTLLKFYVLFSLLALLACGNGGSKDKNKELDNKEAEETKPDSAKTKTIVFFGDSLTAGMGLEPDEAFPAVIQKKLDSLGLAYDVVNAGLSGETTASGKNRLDWVLNQEVDVFVLELGANDGLRGIPLNETRDNLQDIIVAVKKKNPGVRIILAGMQIPPNMGQEYTSEFKAIFPELAEKQDIELIPFLLEDVAGNPKLNQEDGIHPTVEGQKIVAENVWNVLGPILKE